MIEALDHAHGRNCRPKPLIAEMGLNNPKNVSTFEIIYESEEIARPMHKINENKVND